MRDTGPFVVFFGPEDGPPPWIREALTIRDVEGGAHLLYSSGATLLRGLDLAVGDHLHLLGDLLLSRADPRALLLLRYRGRTPGDLVGSPRWFEERRNRWPADPAAPVDDR